MTAAARCDAARDRRSTSRTRCRPRSASATWRFRASTPIIVAVDQAVKILGGEGANRLQQVLRSQKQLTYGASADLDTYKRAGAVDRRDRHADREHRRSAARGRRRVHAPAARARLRRRARRRAGLHGRALPADHRSRPTRSRRRCSISCSTSCRSRSCRRYRERVLQVTPDDIQRVARWFIRPVAAVGRAGRRRRQVRQRARRASASPTSSAFRSNSST